MEGWICVYVSALATQGRMCVQEQCIGGRGRMCVHVSGSGYKCVPDIDVCLSVLGRLMCICVTV